MNSGIYKITCSANGMFYIGSSKHIDKRFRDHRYVLRRGKHQNIVMQRLYDKHGESSFVFEKIIDVPNIADLVKTEQECLNSMKPTINIGREASGGDNLTLHPKRDDIIRRITATTLAKNAKLTPEQRREKFAMCGSSNPNWRGGTSQRFCQCGRRMALSAEKCIKCIDRHGKNNSFYGKEHSREARKRMSKIQIKRYASMTDEERLKKLSGIRVIVVDGKHFCGLSQAAKFLNITIAAVHYRVKSKNFPNTYDGF